MLTMSNRGIYKHTINKMKIWNEIEDCVRPYGYEITEQINDVGQFKCVGNQNSVMFFCFSIRKKQ